MVYNQMNKEKPIRADTSFSYVKNMFIGKYLDVPATLFWSFSVTDAIWTVRY